MDVISYAMGKKAGGSGGTTNYNELTNKPSINDVVLSGNKSLNDLGINGAPIIYSEDRWELHLANDIEVGTYTTKESNIDLELYDLEETRWRITIPFGFFWVVKKYSEAQVGDVFLVFPTGNGFKSYKKTNDQYGFSTNGYTNSSVWTTKDYVDTKTNEIKVQYSSMPTASSTNVGQIVQYTGTTDSTYTNGYFYICVSDGQSTPTYSWGNVNVQASSGGSSNQIFYGNYGWSLHLNNDINVGTYITSSGSNYLELYGLNEQVERINMYFGFFYVVKKYSECSDGDTFIIYIDRYGATGKLTKASNEKGYNGYTNGGNWTNKNRVLLRDNTETYTPTGDYNPATKKYVDDSITSAITTTLGGNY